MKNRKRHWEAPRKAPEPSGIAALRVVVRRKPTYAEVMGSRGPGGPVSLYQSSPSEGRKPQRGTLAHWIVQGVVPGSSPGSMTFVYASVAYGKVVTRKLSPVSRAGELLYGFIKGENTRPETWKANFPAIDPAWGSIQADRVLIHSPEKLLEWASADGRNLIRDDEVAELLARLGPDPELSKLGAERLASLDWKRRFPDIHNRPLVTGQTMLREGPYPHPKKKKK